MSSQLSRVSAAYSALTTKSTINATDRNRIMFMATPTTIGGHSVAGLSVAPSFFTQPGTVTPENRTNNLEAQTMRKQFDSMKRLRAATVALGLAALLALSAGEAKAEVMTLSVIYGGSTFSFTGQSNAVTVSTTIINQDLNGSGYTFSALGASSNWFGTNTSAGGFIADSATLARNGETGGPLTIIVSESGFTLPSGNRAALGTAPTATFAGTTATTSSQSDTGTYTPSTGSSVTAGPTHLESNGTALDSHSTTSTSPIPTYVTPYTLTLTQTISLTQRAASRAVDSVGGNVSVLAHSVPEPASLVMMVTGMPLPLVLMGLLRRHRAAACK